MARVTINVSAYVAPLSIVLNYFTNSCFGFTVSGPAQTTLLMQISSDNGATWFSSSGPGTSPQCEYAEPAVTSLYRVASVTDPVVYSNIIERVIGATAPVTEVALRSGQGYATTEETNICAESLVADCRIATQTAGRITSGDIMYEADGVTRFNGGASTGAFFAYYNVALSIAQQAEGTKVCLIDGDGLIQVHTLCAAF